MVTAAEVIGNLLKVIPIRMLQSLLQRVAGLRKLGVPLRKAVTPADASRVRVGTELHGIRGAAVEKVRGDRTLISTSR
jgi:hypothetical protein